MKPRLSRIFRKSDLKAVIAGDSETFLFYDICSKSAETGADGLPRTRTLWHYKMCPFGTSSWNSEREPGRSGEGTVFPECAHIRIIDSSPEQDGRQAQLP